MFSIYNQLKKFYMNGIVVSIFRMVHNIFSGDTYCSTTHMIFIICFFILIIQVNSMKRLMVANKSWQPTIVAINETSDTGTSSATEKTLRFPHKMIFSKQDAIKENGTVMENGITVGVLTNNNRTTTMLMTPN